MAARSDTTIRNIFYVCLQLTFISEISCSKIPDLRLCGNQECTAVISYARTLAKNRPLDPGFLRFERGEAVKILSKSTGNRQDLWEGEIGGKRGYFPKSFVREYKVEIPYPEYEVPTEEHVPFEEKIMGKASSKADESHTPVAESIREPGVNPVDTGQGSKDDTEIADEAHTPAAESGREPGVNPVDTGQGSKDDTEISDDTDIEETEAGGTDSSEKMKLDESDNRATTVSSIQDKSKHDVLKENLGTVGEKEIEKKDAYLDNPDFPDDTDLPDDDTDDSEIDETDLDDEGYIEEITDKMSADMEPKPETMVDKGQSQQPHAVGAGKRKSDELEPEAIRDDTVVKQTSDDSEDKKQQDMKSDAEAVEEGDIHFERRKIDEVHRGIQAMHSSLLNLHRSHVDDGIQDLNNILKNKMAATPGNINSEPKLENNKVDPEKSKDETDIDETEFGMNDADETEKRGETEVETVKGRSESETADDESNRQSEIKVGETDHSTPEAETSRYMHEDSKEQTEAHHAVNRGHESVTNLKMVETVDEKKLNSVPEINPGSKMEHLNPMEGDLESNKTAAPTDSTPEDGVDRAAEEAKQAESYKTAAPTDATPEDGVDRAAEEAKQAESYKTAAPTDATPEERVDKAFKEIEHSESDHPTQIPVEHKQVIPSSVHSPEILEESPVSNINTNPVADVNLSKVSPSVTDLSNKIPPSATDLTNKISPSATDLTNKISPSATDLTNKISPSATDLTNKISPSRSGVTVIDGTELPADDVPKDIKSDTNAFSGRPVGKENTASSDKVFLDSAAARLESPSVNEKSEHVTLETSQNNFSPVDVSISYTKTSSGAVVMEASLAHTKTPSLESAIVDTSSKTKSEYQVKATADKHFLVIDGTSVPAEYFDPDYARNEAASTKPALFITSVTVGASTKSIIGDATPDLPDTVNTYETQELDQEETNAIQATESTKTLHDDTHLGSQENPNSVDDSLVQHAITTSFREADVSATYQPLAVFHNKTQPARVEQPKVQPSVHDDPYKTREFMSRKPLSYKTDHPGIHDEKDPGSQGQGQSQDMSRKDNSEKIEAEKDLIGQMQDHAGESENGDLDERMDAKEGEHKSINIKNDELTKGTEINVANSRKIDENNNFGPGDVSKSFDKSKRNVKLEHMVEVDENNNKPDTVTPIPVEGEISPPPVEWDTVLPHEESKEIDKSKFEEQSSKESDNFEHILTRKITDGDIDEQPSQPKKSWMQTLESTFKIIIDKLPPTVQSFLEHEPLGMSPQATILTTAITLLVLAALSCSTCACRSGKKTSKKEPIVVVRDLEERLFITTKEKENLEDELKLKNEKILELEQDLQQQEAFSGNADKDLQNYKLHNEALKKQVNTLQEELSAHMEEFQSQTKELHAREKQISSLEIQYQQAEKNLSYLERQVQETNRLLLEKDQEILTINTQVQSFSEQIQHLETRKQQLLDEGEEWGQRVMDLTEQVEQLTEENKRMQEDLSFKENELEVLRDCFVQLKAFESEGEMKEDSDVGASIQDKLRLMMDVSQVNATLKAVEEERNVLDNKYRIEIEARKEMEDQIEQLKKKMETMQTDKMKAERQCTEAQTKLQVLTNYFKEKEADLTRKLGEQEVLKTQNMNKLEYADEKTSQLEQEKELYRTQVEDLKREISTAERDFRSQIAANEKKAHENWLAARAAERELKESRHENGILRQKLTDQERRFVQGPSGLIRPLPTRGMPPPGILEDDYRGSPGPERSQPPPDRRTSGGLPSMGPRPPPPHFDVRSPPPYGMRPLPPPHILDRRSPPPFDRYPPQPRGPRPPYHDMYPPHRGPPPPFRDSFNNMKMEPADSR
ncbi:hypothetical protein ACJMK2_035771, partial [Sinanodonta woodiana]